MAHQLVTSLPCACVPDAPGRKRWALYPPERPPPGVALVDDGQETSPDDALTSLQWFMEVYPQLPPHMRPLEFVQEPGERCALHQRRRRCSNAPQHHTSHLARVGELQRAAFLCTFYACHALLAYPQHPCKKEV